MEFAKSNRSKWIVAAFSMVALMAVAGAGCTDDECVGAECAGAIRTPADEPPPSAGECRRVCETLYGGCGAFQPNEDMKGACRLSCAEGGFDNDVVACLDQAECNKDAINSCLDDEPVFEEPTEDP